jgi:hypothetical protein
MQHTIGKLLTRATTLIETSSQSEVYMQSYGLPKLREYQLWQFRELSLESPETKCRLDVGLVERHIVYYKGESGGFPQVRAMMSLVSPNCLWFVLEPKVF